jgi:alpha-D-xyloside xylohydrolase
VKDTPIDILPLYVKAGSILPIGPEVQYSTEKSWDNLEIKVYPGCNGEFTLYEDENDNYNYEKGMYSTITMKWNDRTRMLTIENRKGEFSGMLKERKFNIVTADGAKKAVAYNGKKVTVKM